jgi:hypothetical protein
MPPDPLPPRHDGPDPIASLYSGRLESLYGWQGGDPLKSDWPFGPTKCGICCHDRAPALAPTDPVVLERRGTAPAAPGSSTQLRESSRPLRSTANEDHASQYIHPVAGDLMWLSSMHPEHRTAALLGIEPIPQQTHCSSTASPPPAAPKLHEPRCRRASMACRSTHGTPGPEGRQSTRTRHHHRKSGCGRRGLVVSLSDTILSHTG